jgi:hypothetical protein
MQALPYLLKRQNLGGACCVLRGWFLLFHILVSFCSHRIELLDAASKLYYAICLADKTEWD